MTITEYIFSDCHNIIRSAISQEDLLDKYHRYYEKKIFSYFKDRYLGQLREWWATYTLPIISETDRCIFLYEPRCHDSLEFLIYNLAYFARGWGLIIYCSKASHTHISNILKHNKFRAILHIVRDDEGGIEARDHYIGLVKSLDFWNSIPCKYLLMCEMDTYLRKSLPSDINKYDYICAKWPWHPHSPGGSGLSIRNVSSMKRICTELPDLHAVIFDQDSWAAEGCKRLNMTFNNSYFVEADHYNTEAVGFHNWWTFISPERLVQLANTYEKYLTLDL